MTYKRSAFLHGVKRIAAVVLITSIMVFSSGQAFAAGAILRQGSRGQEVIRLQQELKSQSFFHHWRITDYFGPITRNAVIQFQRSRGLTPDGIVGPKTTAVLYGATVNGGALSFGMRGTEVVKLQNALRNRGLFWANSTGYYGKITQDAVIAFQRSVGLPINGIANMQTQNALYNHSTTVAAQSNRSGATATQAKEDLYWLARIIHAESAGEPYNGQVAVGNVVLNRVHSPNFPNSIYGVIFEYWKSIPQFSPVADGSIYNTPSSQSIRAAEEAYAGAKPVGNALYFFNPQKAAGTWIVNNRRYMTTISNHAFYH